MDKPLPKSDPVFKCAKKRVSKMLDELDGSEVLTDDQVHDVRVCTKKLRALLQLYRPACRKAGLKTVDHAIRDLARTLSSARDAHVQHAMLERMVQAFGQEYQGNLHLLLEHYGVDDASDVSMPQTREVREGFEHLLVTWRGQLHLKGKPDIGQGLEFAYKHARKLAYEAESSDDDELYHECRKWVKYFHYQLQLVVKDMRPRDKSYLKGLQKLGECLGEFHDRCVLERSLNQLLSKEAQENAELESAGLLMLSWLVEQKRCDKEVCQKLFEKLFTRTHNPVKC